MIHVSQLQKIYHNTRNENVTALDNVTLHINRGEIFGIIGPSGAGKSTLLRCINMLEQPTSGSISVNRVEVTELNQQELRNMRKQIGMIFQHFNLLSSKTVCQNIAFPMEISDFSKSEINKRVQELLSLVGLVDKAQDYPSRLSGGQKQRVGIARALANKPKVLLCDEATSSLDPDTTRSILELLKSINEHLGLTILMITHEMQVVKQICHSVAVIQNGSIIEQGSVEKLFSKPSTAISRSFLRSMETICIPDRIIK